MTREHKLALIIGFSLILFVGILISDHLSKAGGIGGLHESAVDAEQRLAETIGPLDIGLAPRPLPERPGGAMERQRELVRQTPPPVEPEPELQPELAAASGAERPLLIPVNPDETRESLIQSGWRLLDHVVSGIGDTPPQPALVIEQSRGAPAPGAALPEGPFVTHVVQRGESLYQIAEKYYGSGGGAQWTRIRDFNTGRIGEDGMVRQGVTIRIPGVEEKPRQAPPAAGAVAERPAAIAAAATRSYTVRRNDTLGEIAQQLLGSARRRAEIIELNRDQITNEDEIRVGMVLAIPAG